MARSKKTKTAKKTESPPVPSAEVLRAEIEEWRREWDLSEQSGSNPVRTNQCSRKIGALQKLLKDHYGLDS